MTTTEPVVRERSFPVAEKEVLLAFLVSRVLIWILAWLAFRWIVHGTAFPIAGGDELWDLLFRWDSNWYGRIAQSGYEYLADEPSSVAFFPLYPICIRAVGAMTGGQVTLAGFLVSNTALVGAVILLRRHLGLAAATAHSEGLYLAALMASTGLMAVCLVLYVCGYWMT